MQNKEVLVTITGTQIDSDGNKNVDTTEEKGRYYKKGLNSYVIINNPAMGKNEAASTSRYKFNHRFLEVVKNGDISSKIYLEAGKEYATLYKTMYGQMELSFKTDSFSIVETEDRIEISAKYSIFSSDNLISKNMIKIVIS